MAAGAALLLECFGRFAIQGRGTPAPIAPPDRLVITGPYRRVRNPMYVAVTAMILGQAALFTDLRLLIYGLVLWAGFHLFVLAYEEPTLRQLFPQDYAAFFAAVPRWPARPGGATDPAPRRGQTQAWRTRAGGLQASAAYTAGRPH